MLKYNTEHCDYYDFKYDWESILTAYSRYFNMDSRFSLNLDNKSIEFKQIYNELKKYDEETDNIESDIYSEDYWEKKKANCSNKLQMISSLAEYINEGDSESALFVALFYYWGVLPFDCIKLSIPWLEKASSWGSSDASYLLSVWYMDGYVYISDGCTRKRCFKIIRRNIRKAIEYAKLSICQNGKDGYKYGLLGLLYSTCSEHIAPNRSELAITNYIKATEMGDSFSSMLLGEVYAKGLIVPKDIDKALKYSEIAAGKGDVRAMLNLYKWYNGDNGFPVNPEKADYWMGVAKEHDVLFYE